MKKNISSISPLDKIYLRTHLAEQAYGIRQRTGKAPLPAELVPGKRFSQTAFAGFFGSYEKFCREMDFDFFTFREGDAITLKEMVEIVTRTGDVLGQAPSMRQFTLITGLNIKDIKKHFRNLTWAVAYADLQVHLSRSRMFSDNRLLNILKSIGKSTKRTPVPRDIRKLGVPNVKVYKSRFGSFRNALIEAGFKVDDPPKINSPIIARKKRISKLIRELSE